MDRWAIRRWDTRISARASACCRIIRGSASRLRMAASFRIRPFSRLLSMSRRTNLSYTFADCWAMATVSGRYYAMDRDNRWDRTGLTYVAMTRGEGQQADSALAAIQQAYDKNVTDEFIVPTVVMEQGKPVATVKAGDAVIHYNFRPD